MIDNAERVNGTRPTHAPPTRAERAATDAEARARRDTIRDEARHDRERRAEQRADERERRRAELRAQRAQARADRATAWQARADRWRRALVLVGAIVGVNAVAVIGQVSAFTATKAENGFEWSLPQALATAAVIESIAIYVGWHAHVALIEGDSVMRLRITSYAIAAGVGALNYHHYAKDWTPSESAVMFGAASILSPWLWAIHSRHQHRQALRENGLIDPRAPKFSALRWLLHRAETWKALRWAVRYGEQSPGAAILAVQTDETTAEAAVLLDGTRDSLVAAQSALIRAQSDALKVAELVAAEYSSTPLAVPAPGPELYPAPSAEPTPVGNSSGYTPATTPGTPAGTPGEIEPSASPDHEVYPDSDPASDREKRDEQDNRAAEKWIRAEMRKGRTPTLGEVGDRFDRSRNWARTRVQTARDQMTAQGYRFLPRNVVTPPAGPAVSEDSEETAGGAS